jgi:hypothetical protein
MEIGHVPRSHDRQEDQEVRRVLSCRIHERLLNLFISALSLRLFGEDITTVGQQQKAKSQNENQATGHRTETPVEHAPMLEEDKEPTPVIDDENSET